MRISDLITVYAMEYYSTFDYGYFHEHQLCAASGEEVNLTLMGKRVTGGKSFPLKGVNLVTFVVHDKLNMYTDIITDDRGNATICFRFSETYVLSAKRADTSIEYVLVLVREKNKKRNQYNHRFYY